MRQRTIEGVEGHRGLEAVEGAEGHLGGSVFIERTEGRRGDRRL